MRLLLIDNDDSFTHNLAHLLYAATGSGPHITGHKKLINRKNIQEESQNSGYGLLSDYDMVVISPGPGRPEEYSCYGNILESGVPVLGICLGMQIINRHFGGVVGPLPQCIHGKTDEVIFTSREAKGKKLTVGRYHSLHCVTLGRELTATAYNAQNIIMALCHNRYPIYGYQFHPESFLTDQGIWCIRHALSFFHLL